MEHTERAMVTAVPARTDRSQWVPVGTNDSPSNLRAHRKIHDAAYGPGGCRPAAGSSPLACVAARCAAAPCAAASDGAARRGAGRMAHLTTDQKVRGSSPFGRTNDQGRYLRKQGHGPFVPISTPEVPTWWNRGNRMVIACRKHVLSTVDCGVEQSFTTRIEAGLASPPGYCP